MTELRPGDSAGDASRLEGLFERAVELPAAEHADFAARECGGDAGLQQELLRLLAAHGGDDHLRRLGAGVALLRQPDRTTRALSMPGLISFRATRRTTGVCCSAA